MSAPNTVTRQRLTTGKASGGQPSTELRARGTTTRERIPERVVHAKGPQKTSKTPEHPNCRNTGVHHVGLHAKDPAASAEFYREILGMQIVGGSGPEHPLGATAFLCSRPDEESHEVALFANPEYAHFAFKVASLGDLKSLYARLLQKGIPIKFTFNHGVAFAFYFDDPDGHMIEVYWPTEKRPSHRQPYAEPLDLTQPDELLLKQVGRRAP